MRKRRISLWVMLGLWVLMGLILLAAHLSRSLTDWYIAHIFPLISGFWSRISGIFPFSVGEWMIVAGVAMVLLFLIGMPLILIFGRVRRKALAGFVLRFYGWVITCVFCVVTMRFLVQYQGTQLSQTLQNTTYSNQQVLDVYQKLIEAAEAESAYVHRDENGHFILADRSNLIPEAKACMARLGETYPQFKGYYPDAKPIYHAYFFTQQNLLGIYYPHSMEANYNPVVYEYQLPYTICHEYTHLKGNIFEDEAGYYGFLACMTSENHDFRYSGYLAAIEWFSPNFGDDTAAWEQYDELYNSVSEGLYCDLYTFVPPDYLEEHQKTDEIIPTAIVENTAESVMDASLKVNGISEGTSSYYGITALLLDYYLNS